MNDTLWSQNTFSVTEDMMMRLCKTIRKTSSFPDVEHTYDMHPCEISKLKQYLGSKNKP